MSRAVAQDEFVQTYKLDHTRAAWAARNAVSIARREGAAAAIVSCFEELHAMATDHGKLLKAYAKGQSPTADPQLVTADHRLDRNFSSFHHRVEMEVEIYGSDSPRGKAAQAMLDGPLSAPVHSVTNVHREEQETEMREILDTLESEHLNGIKICELESHFDVLKGDFADFVERMSVEFDTTAPTRDAVRASAEDLQAKILECIWRAGGAFPTNSPQDLEMRSKLLGPFAVQNDKLAAFYRAHRGGQPPAVDPDTGQEDPATDSTETDTPRADEPVVN